MRAFKVGMGFKEKAKDDAWMDTFTQNLAWYS
jgi:hypothetical protein